MTSRFVAAAVSAALCSASAWPAMAQEYRPVGFDAPAGATATLNLRVPIGGRDNSARPSWGLTVSHAQRVGTPTLDGGPAVREVRLADLRFEGSRVRQANVASFDLAHLDQDRRMNFRGGGWWLPVVAVVAVGVGVLLIASGGDENQPAG